MATLREVLRVLLDESEVVELYKMGDRLGSVVTDINKTDRVLAAQARSRARGRIGHKRV